MNMKISSKKNDNNKLPILFENSPKGDFLFKIFLSSILWCFLCITINFIYSGYDWDKVYEHLILVFVISTFTIFTVGIILISIAFFNKFLLENFKKKNGFFARLLIIIVTDTACFFELMSYFTVKRESGLIESLLATLIFGSIGFIIFIIFHAIISPILNFILKSK